VGGDEPGDRLGGDREVLAAPTSSHVSTLSGRRVSPLRRAILHEITRRGVSDHVASPRSTRLAVPSGPSNSPRSVTFGRPDSCLEGRAALFDRRQSLRRDSPTRRLERRLQRGGHEFLDPLRPPGHRVPTAGRSCLVAEPAGRRCFSPGLEIAGGRPADRQDTSRTTRYRASSRAAWCGGGRRG
jgi:hypothetical protein